MKNFIILASILIIILGSTFFIDFAKSIAKSIENYFDNKTASYSNLSSSGQKYQSSFKSSSSNNTYDKPSNKSYNKNKSLEERDKNIMNNQNTYTPSKVNQKNKEPQDESFNMQFKELDDF